MYFKNMYFSNYVFQRYFCKCILTFQVIDLIIPTADTVRQTFFLEVYVTHEVPLLFVGPTGTGKSAITNNYLVKLPKDKYASSITLYLFICLMILGIYQIW